MSNADESYKQIMGLPPVPPAQERTAPERRESLEALFALVQSLPVDDFANSFLRERPLNASILEEEPHPAQNESAA